MFHAMEMYAKEETAEMKETSFVAWTDLTQDRDCRGLLFMGQHILEFHKMQGIFSLAGNLNQMGSGPRRYYNNHGVPQPQIISPIRFIPRIRVPIVPIATETVGSTHGWGWNETWHLLEFPCTRNMRHSYCVILLVVEWFVTWCHSVMVGYGGCVVWGRK
jgi:hypothetical protein